jgi:hypothetical protein
MKLTVPDDLVDTPQKAYRFCEKSGVRIPELELLILQDVGSANCYVNAVIKGRWPEAEEVIRQYPGYACSYAQCTIKGPWPEAEEVILKHSSSSMTYAQVVLKRRWPEAEETIYQDQFHWYSYKDWLRRLKPTDRDKWQWLRAGITDELLDILNHFAIHNVGMNQDMQEFVCQTRPDLIGKIFHLRAKLRRRYSHEEALSKVDL